MSITIEFIKKKHFVLTTNYLENIGKYNLNIFKTHVDLVHMDLATQNNL